MSPLDELGPKITVSNEGELVVVAASSIESSEEAERILSIDQACHGDNSECPVLSRRCLSGKYPIHPFRVDSVLNDRDFAASQPPQGARQTLKDGATAYDDTREERKDRVQERPIPKPIVAVRVVNRVHGGTHEARTPQKLQRQEKAGLRRMGMDHIVTETESVAEHLPESKQASVSFEDPDHVWRRDQVGEVRAYRDIALLRDR
jgi:hypothetical protein